MDVTREGSKRKRIVRRSLVAVLAVFGVAIVSVGLARLEPAPPTIEKQSLVIKEVERGTMVREVRAIGSLVPIDVTLKTAESDGRVVALPLKPGTRVTPDTIIIRMANPELEKELEDAKWALASANATYKSQQEVLKNQLLDLRSLEANIRGERNNADLQADVDEQLYEDKLISGQRYKLSQGRRDQLKERLKIAQDKVKNFEGSIEPQLEVYRAKTAQAEGLHKLKLRQVANLEIRAGVDGILQQLGAAPPGSTGQSLEIGQWVVSGSPLAMITDPTNLQAELRVSETQARDILLGQPVEIDARVAKIKGTVIRIDPSVSQGMVNVDVRIDSELPNGARPDLSVNGTILIEQLDGVLFSGRMAFDREGTTVGVYKVRPDGLHADLVQVTLGRSSVRTVEIESGLAEGDRVICSDMQAWLDHPTIRLQ